ncbi:tetratricopeptide repeat protein [bacterium SCSIO 12696]|nr:tetratricopeptide repeat protein [bacterium SCSIO 12696]
MSKPSGPQKTRIVRQASAVLVLLSLLSGCASVHQDSATVADAAPQATPEPAADPAPKPPLRPFEPETLFDLLVADFAGANQQYGLQLNRYRKQALATRDPGLAAQATWLAVQLNAPQQALELSKLWAELEPQSPEANRIAGYYLAYAKQLPEALPHALTALRQDDKEAIYAVARLIRAEDTTDQQRQQLHSELTRLIADGPFNDLADHPQIALLDANLMILAEDYKAAIARASNILEPDTERDSALILIANATLQQDGLEATLEFLQNRVEAYPDSKRLRLQLARQWAEKDLQRSRSELDKLVAKFPDDHRLRYSLALINAQLGFYDEAQDLLGTLVEVAELKDNAHYQLGQVHEAQENYSAAIENYQKVAAGEHYGKAVTGQIRLLAETDRDNDLNALIEQMLALDPEKTTDTYLDIASVLAANQHTDRAMALINTALEKEPQNWELLYNRSLLHEQQGNTASSHKDLRVVIGLQPDNPDALNALGYSLTNSKDPADYPEAYELIRKALELDPENPAILDSMGWALFRLEKLEEALPYLSRAFELYPDPEVAAHLGEVLWQLGKRTEALTIWQENLAKNPGAKHIVDTMERLGATQVSHNQSTP